MFEISSRNLQTYERLKNLLLDTVDYFFKKLVNLEKIPESMKNS